MGIVANIATVGDVLSKQLCIPDYQRDYRWTTENVYRLLEDIRASMESGKQEYRVGSVILYRKATSDYEIVDGQQRITTILLVIRKVLGEMQCRALAYKRGSVAAILANDEFIGKWLADNADVWQQKFVDYLKSNCKFAEIVVDDLSEAFQMFDTQNGRGKSLEAYNLLKAYHIRAMEQNTQEEKIQCDRDWESATQYDATPDIDNDPNVDILKQLFSEQLYKGRICCRGDIRRPNGDVKEFSKDDIGEFKGFTIDRNHPIEFPFQNPFLLQYLTEKFYKNVLSGSIGVVSRLNSGESGKCSPFVSINQTIINGKSFFEYIQTYVELYKKMFIELGTYQLAEFKKFYYYHCLMYDRGSSYAAMESPAQIKKRQRTSSFRDRAPGAGRCGDGYLREAYKSLCFLLLDKFGERVFNKYYETLYRLVYTMRLNSYAVKYSTVLERVVPYFRIIDSARAAIDLVSLERRLSKVVDEGNFDYSGKIANESLVEFIKGGR